MNFGAIVAALRGNADVGMFSANVDPTQWIIRAYARVWGAGDWPFKLNTLDADIVAGDTFVTIDLINGLFKPILIFDENDQQVEYLAPVEFFRTYGAGATDDIVGHPSQYSFFNGSILIGPRSDAAYGYRVVYEMQKYVFDAGRVFTLFGDWDGVTMTQEPAWDSGFHWLLVNGAAAHGYALMGSPLSEMHGRLFEQGINEMIAFYAPFDRRENVQFLRDALR